MEERSIIAYEHYRDASQRFEYFYSGIIAALCAYIAQSFKPAQIGWNPNTLELLSLIILFISFFFSLKRMEKIVQVFRGVHRKLHNSEIKGKLVAHIDIAPFINEQTGKVYTIQDVDKELNFLDFLLPKVEGEIHKINSSAESYYKLRNWFFYLGFVLLIISKILYAYVKVA